MRDKKHIDRVFQEGLKDFEAMPTDAVWKNIEAELNKDEKKRRVIPIWWRYAGAAAALILLLTIGRSSFFTQSEDSESLHQVVDTETTRSSDNSNHSEQIKEVLQDTNAVISKNQTSENVINNASESDKNHQKTNNTHQNTSKSTLSPGVKSSINKSNIQQNSNKTSVAYTASKEEKEQSLNKSNSTNAVAKNTSEEENNKTEVTSPNSTSNKDTYLASTKNTTETPENITNNKAAKTKMTIEEALDEVKDIAENTTPINRWSLAANAAPVYFNAGGKGSSIDPQLNNNSKTGEINMSYGVTASYAVNKRLRVRSGVSRVNLGYNTNDVLLYQSIGSSATSSTLQNVRPNNNEISDSYPPSSSLSVINAGNLSEKGTADFLKTSSTSINQSLGYIEVPLELQYAVLANKFGINVIGGFSSLFLNNNEVYSEGSTGSRTFLGEANNINKVSYSANFGLGLNYQVTKKIDLNLEPMLKYQINTFENTSGDFQPFFVGVYTGLAIKF